MNTSFERRYPYYVYGEMMLSNVELPMLQAGSLEKCGDDTIYLNVTWGSVNENSGIGKSKCGYSISFSEVSTYYVYEKEARIDCIASNLESLLSTLFNIPFSVYFLIRNELLVHGCSMILRDKCVCFVGKKGIGKSTLVSLLDDEDFGLFGDDTLRIKRDLTSYRAHNLIKITKETVKNLKINYELTEHKNLVGKYYGLLPHVDNGKIVSSIVELFRSETNISMKKITPRLIRNNILKSNIVGINWFDKYLFGKIQNATLDSHIDCYTLQIPNDVSMLIDEKENIKRMLSEYL